jgi:meiotically up-regulated gene 157 (Mug157) protein
MNMQRMNAAMTASKNVSEMIGKGNFQGAENYSIAASKRLGNDYVRYHKTGEGKEVMINFPANIDSKPIIGALQAGDPTYKETRHHKFYPRVNGEKNSPKWSTLPSTKFVS